MIELAIISALAGAVLGLRFKVLVLLPSTGVVLVVALGIGIATAHSFSSIALAATLCGASLQLGYFGATISQLTATRKRGVGRIPRQTLPTEPDARV
jgi:hypothetical protein